MRSTAPTEPLQADPGPLPDNPDAPQRDSSDVPRGDDARLRLGWRVETGPTGTALVFRDLDAWGQPRKLEAGDVLASGSIRWTCGARTLLSERQRLEGARALAAWRRDHE